MTHQPNILFYLSECKTCNVFMTTAQKGGLLKYFNLVCIDGKKEHYKTKGLKTVPTIIVPSQGKTFVGAECLEWLKQTLKVSNSKHNYSSSNDMHEVYVPQKGYVAKPVQNQPSINELSQQLNHLSSKLSNVAQIQSQSSKIEIPNTNLIKRKNLITIQQPPSVKVEHTTTQTPSIRTINQLIGFTQNEMTGFSDTYAYTNRDDALPKSFLPPDHDNIIFTAPEGEKIDKQKQDELIKCAETQREFDKEKLAKTMNDINEQIKMGNKNLIPKWHDST